MSGLHAVNQKASMLSGPNPNGWLCVIMLCAIMFAFAPRLAEAQETFPYEASVSTVSAIVHAAPSSHAYATEQLERGEVVEVYRHDPGGWCAIRPPVGSFSLLPKDSLRPTEDPRVAEVTRDGAKSWVGTRIENRLEPLWQVRLAAGERVELLSPWNELGADDQWVLIAPPAGEFRWVHERELRRDEAPATVLVPNAPRNDDRVVRASATEPQEMDATTSTAGTFESPTTTERPAAEAEGNSLAERRTSVAPPAATNTGGWRRTDDPRNGTDTHPTETRTASGSPVDLSPRDLSEPTAGPSAFSERLAQAQLWFDHLLAGKATVAPERLAEELRQLEASAASTQQREFLTELQGRFTRWQDLELRRLALDRLASQSTGTNTPNAENTTNESAARRGFPGSLTSLSEMIRGAADVPAPGGRERPEFAAEGTLTRMIRDGGLRSSSYAIQDSTGRVVAMVVPGPGVNLERYLRQEVGVMGESSPNPTLGLPTVIADRVVDLNRR